MPIVVNAPNGDAVSFPDGTNDATINQAMAQSYGHQAQPAAAGAPVQGPAAQPNGQAAQPPAQGPKPDFLTSLEAGTDKAFDNSAELLSEVPVIGPLINNLGGPNDTAQAVAAQHKAYFDAQAAQGHGSNDPVGSFLGSVLGSVPATAGLRNPWAAGAVGGAVNTNDPKDIGGTALDAGAGAVGGKLFSSAANLVGNAINPIIRPAVSRLMAAGVKDLTPGQIIGGTAQMAENTARMAPFVGDVVAGAQDRSLTGFNNAAYNSALSDIGQKLPPNITGHDAAAFTQQAISQQYDKILPTLQIKIDPQFRADSKVLSDYVQSGGLPPDKLNQFSSLIAGIGQRFNRAGGMTGRTMQEVDSKLGQEYADYRASPNPDDQKYARAVLQTQQNLREMVYRTNPDQELALRGMRSAFQKFVPLEMASGGAGTDELGRFQPGQLKTAAANNATTRQMSQGRATQQGLAEDAQGVMGRSIPKPNGVNRLLFNALGAGGALAAHFNPMVIGPAAVAAAPYTKIGGDIAREVLTGRQGPAWAAAGGAVRSLARPASVLGGVGAPKRVVPNSTPDDASAYTGGMEMR